MQIKNFNSADPNTIKALLKMAKVPDDVVARGTIVKKEVE